MQGLGVNLERGELAHVVLQHLQQLRLDRRRPRPSASRTTFWRSRDLRTLELDVELDVLRQAGAREVGRADERGRADDLQLAVRDVGLGVELLRLVDADLDLAGGDAVDHRLGSGEEGVAGLPLLLDRSLRRSRAAAIASAVARLVSPPISRRILSTFCQCPSRARNAPISKWPVAMSIAELMSHHSRTYCRAFQCSAVLSTMN